MSQRTSYNSNPWESQNDDEGPSYNLLSGTVQSALHAAGVNSSVDPSYEGYDYGDDGLTDDEDEQDEQEALQQSLLEEEEDLQSGYLRSAANYGRSGIRKVIASPQAGQYGFMLFAIFAGVYVLFSRQQEAVPEGEEGTNLKRPDFVYGHPYVTSSYYLATKSIETLIATDKLQVQRIGGYGELAEHKFKTRLAIVRPFCEFDADSLPSTFAVWNQLPPCRAAATDLDFDEDPVDKEKAQFDDVSVDVLKEMVADVFLFYSQTYSENAVAMDAVDQIINQFNEPGGWSQCIANIYAIEANIPQELDLYIPSAQELLYSWVNGPNRQFEAAFRIIQSGEWGQYDGFYLMEGDSIPVKNHWLDVILSQVEDNRPFAILGAKYNGDKWDNFYEQIPIALLHHINGNAIYNTSHPLMERLVGQLEVEAPCPYNSIPYDFRMSQMCVEGALGIVPDLAKKIMLNEEGKNITLSNNTGMFSKWWDMHKDETPMKETPAIHNYAATNLIPRHLGPEYVIHGAKLYAPWNPSKTQVTLVVSEWFYDRSTHLLEKLDDKDHPFSEVVIMLPPSIEAKDSYTNYSVVPTRAQHRSAPDFMDLCEADIATEWFMITNSYHQVATHVDLMFTPGTFVPVCPFTPATYPFCFKFPYCKENVNHAQKFNPGHNKVVLDFDVLYNTKMRNQFCDEWKERFGDEGQNLYTGRRKDKFKDGKIAGPSGPTGTSYVAYLFREKKDKMYKFTDRSLYGARDPFIKIFAKEEKEDGMSEKEKHLRALSNRNLTDTNCNCKALESQTLCEESAMGCIWRPLFESCRPPEMIDGGVPICLVTEPPTMAPTEHDPLDDTEEPSVSPSKAPRSSPWYSSIFKTVEHEKDLESKKEKEFMEKARLEEEKALEIGLKEEQQQREEDFEAAEFHKPDVDAGNKVVDGTETNSTSTLNEDIGRNEPASEGTEKSSVIVSNEGRKIIMDATEESPKFIAENVAIEVASKNNDAIEKSQEER